MALLAGGGSAQLQRDPGTAGAVQGFRAAGELHGARLASGLPLTVRFLAGDGQAQLAPPSGDIALTAATLSSGAAVLGAPALAQDHAITAQALESGAAQLGTPALSSGGTNDALTAANLAAGTPTLGQPALAQAHALTASGLYAAAAVLAAPALAQAHALAAQGLASGAPVLGAPSITSGQLEVPLTALGLYAQAAMLGVPALAQSHSLAAQALAAGLPTLAAPALDTQGTFPATEPRRIAPLPAEQRLAHAGWEPRYFTQPTEHRIIATP